jgi:uncharacterized protein YjbI with pentapeptide repeats
MKIQCATDELVEVAVDKLAGSNLDGLGLHRALLEGQDMQDASLVGTDLRGAFLSGANLSSVVSLK